MTRASLPNTPPPRANVHGPLNHPAKAVYFATGSPELALQDIVRLGLTSNGTALRVVSPQAGARKLSGQLELNNAPVLPYTASRAIWLWLKLLMFLGFTRDAELICLNTPQNYRLLKLLAFSLRGRGRFSTGESQTPPLTAMGMVRLSWRSYWIRREERSNALPMLFIGSGSARSLRLIVTQVRIRFPHGRFVALLPESLAGGTADLFDEARTARPGAAGYLRAALWLLSHCRAYRGCFIPCTNEFERWMRSFALLLPFRFTEIYNEVGDAFNLADWRSGFRHLRWRFLQTDRKLSWPIAVIGSSSGFYLEKIVASLHKSFPGTEVHGWLGPLQAESAAHLFDVVHRLPATGFSLASCRMILARGRRYSNWIVPCTDEPFGWMKLLAIALPLPRRRLYNERGDGFPLRQLSTVWRHVCWRLRHKFTFQFLAASPNSSLLHRLVHVPAYAVRLALAAPMLLRATHRKPVPAHGNNRGRCVEVLTTSKAQSQEGISRALSGNDRSLLLTREISPGEGVLEQLLAAANSSQADFLCLLDGQCEFSAPGWLSKLLDSFDETVAQAGPELLRTDTHELCQGAFFDTAGALFWNTQSAARFHSRPQLLEVAALPWVCLVIRREALLQVSDDCQRRRAGSEWILAELSEQLNLNGWLSICNTDVSISHPLKARAEQYQLSTAS